MGYRDIKKEKINNKGFSLVELLVAVALVAVVGTAVFGFMTVGARTFTSTSSEVNLQSESQLAFNQMQDLIIDTAVGIDYGYLPAGSVLDPEDYHSYAGNWTTVIPAGTACEAKKLVMYNLDNVYELTWVKADEKLYYTEYTTDTSVTTEVRRVEPAVESHVLLAEYVKDFDADLSLMQAKRIIRLDTVYEKSGKEYTSSHNITLRNKPLSGNSIPAYLEPVLDSELKGVIGRSDIYLKPGEELNLTALPIVASGDDIKDLDGSTVLVSAGAVNSSHVGYVARYNDPNPSGTGYSFMDGPQNIRFSIKSGQSGCYSTVDPDTGLLTISPAQANNFELTVTATYGISTKVKKVNIHILRIESITMSYEGVDATAIDTSVSQNGLKKDEEFIIKAKVNTYNGITNEVSDKSHTGIDYSVAWDKTKGNSLFDAVSGSATGPDSTYTSTCRFKMGEVNATGTEIEVSATSTESVNIGYKASSGALAPVIGRISGTTYKEPEDPGKKFDSKDNVGDFERGAQYVVNLAGINAGTYQNNMEQALAMEDGSILDLKGMIKVIDLHIYETEFVLDDSGINAVAAGNEKEITNDCMSSDEVLIASDANWRFCAPMWYSPNSKYRYVLQHKIVVNPDPSKQNEYDYKWYTVSDAQTLYNSFGKGDMNGKDPDGNSYIRATGSKLDVTFDRLKLEYLRDNDTPENFYTFGENKSQTVEYYPRGFNKTQPAKEFFVPYSYDKSFMQQGSYTERDGFHWPTFKFYHAQSDGVFKYGSKIDDEDSISAEYAIDNNFLTTSDTGSKGWNNLFSIETPKFKLRFNGYENKSSQWKTIDKQFRMLPIVKIDHGTRYDGEYILLDSYVNINTWNIEIPSDGFLASLLGISNTAAAERSYFPLPSDYNFPGKNVDADSSGLRHVGIMDDSSGREVWSGYKQWAGSCCKYNNWSHPDNLYYTLTEHAHSDGTTYWELILFAQRSSGDRKWTAFQKYTCENNGKMWNPASASEFKDRYTNDTLPILNL